QATADQQILHIRAEAEDRAHFCRGRLLGAEAEAARVGLRSPGAPELFDCGAAHVPRPALHDVRLVHPAAPAPPRGGAAVLGAAWRGGLRAESAAPAGAGPAQGEDGAFVEVDAQL